MTSPSLTGSGFTLNAAALYDVAASAALEMRNSDFLSDLRHDLALISIVFAAASLEAFINELAALANYLRNPDAGWGMTRMGVPQSQLDSAVWRKVWGSEPFMHMYGGIGRRGDPPAVHTLGDLLDELEESHGPIRAKYVLALSMLAGIENPRGTEPFQSFDLLISIRDTVLHSKREKYRLRSDSPDERAGRLLRRLEKARIILKREPSVGWSFLQNISAPSVGNWACNVAAQMVSQLVTAAPDGDLKTVLQFAYAERFSLIPVAQP